MLDRTRQVFGNKYEDAAELMENAGNQYKVAKQYQRAGECFMKCAQMHWHLKSKHNARKYANPCSQFDGTSEVEIGGRSYQEAAKNFKKTSTQEALTCLKMAITMYDNGDNANCAKGYKEIAEL